MRTLIHYYGHETISLMVLFRLRNDYRYLIDVFRVPLWD